MQVQTEDDARSSKSGDETVDDEPVDLCSSCTEAVKEDDKAMTCDTCGEWCHIACGQITEDVYEYLTSNEDEEVHWMCPSCINIASDPRTKPQQAFLPPV